MKPPLISLIETCDGFETTCNFCEQSSSNRPVIELSANHEFSWICGECIAKAHELLTEALSRKAQSP